MKAFFNWSGGKDSALALYHAQKDKQYSIERLLTNINGMHRRISMHGVREELLELQAQAIGLPLQKVILPEEPSMQDRKSTRLNSSHLVISYAVFCLKKKRFNPNIQILSC